MNLSLKVGALATIAVATVGLASATTFTNVHHSGSVSGSGFLDDGFGYTTSGNSISFTTPNAAVGDLEPTRAGGLTIQYDAMNGAFTGDNWGVNSTTLGALLGSGKLVFTEQIFKIDGSGNEFGGPIGSLTQVFDANSTVLTGTIHFTSMADDIRVKKSFTLLAPDSKDPQVIDFASVQLVNQSLVPEPSSIAALGLGGLVLLRRRRK